MAVVITKNRTLEMSNIDKVIIIVIFVYLFFKLLEQIGKIPVKFKIGLSELEKLELYLKILLYRGKLYRRESDGRMFVKFEDKKIMLKKYQYFNVKGIYIFIPFYEKGLKNKIENILKEKGFSFPVWKEERRDLKGKCIGIDIEEEIKKGTIVVESVIRSLKREDRKREKITIYFKSIYNLEKDCDYDIRLLELNDEKRKELMLTVDIRSRFLYWVGKILFFNLK